MKVRCAAAGRIQKPSDRPPHFKAHSTCTRPSLPPWAPRPPSMQELRAQTSQLGAILQSMDDRLKRLELALTLMEEGQAETAAAAEAAPES